MTDGLLKELQAAFKPELFVNHYGSSEIYTFTIDQNAPNKPGSAGRAGINQMVRVVRLGASSPGEIAQPGEEGEIIALLQGDESFEGYWRRPEADAKALRHGWYFTGDTGSFDADGDLFVTGRVDDMIITGGENVSPVEIESCLSLHKAVSEVAVVGLADERWGKVVTAFIKRSARSSTSISTSIAATLAWPPSSGRAAMSSSRPFRNRRSASYCAACWWPANTIGTKRPSPLARNRCMSSAAVFEDPRLAALDGFRVEIDENARARGHHSRPGRRSTWCRCRSATSSGWCSKAWTTIRACGSSCCARSASISPAAATSRLPGSASRNGLQARVEHRRARALLEARDRREPRLLLRCRLRTVARLRLPHRLGNRLLRPP